MTKQQVVQKLIQIAAANQPAYIWTQLKIRGLNTNQFQPAGSELESGLWSLYANDERAFWQVLKGLNFDDTKTNSSTDGSLILLAQDQGLSQSGKITLKGAWDWITGSLGGHSETVTPSTTTTTTTANVAAIAGLVVLFLAAVWVVWFAFFRKS